MLPSHSPIERGVSKLLGPCSPLLVLPIGLTTWKARGQGDGWVVGKHGEGSGGVDGDFLAQLTSGQKESGHAGRREEPGSIH